MLVSIHSPGHRNANWRAGVGTCFLVGYRSGQPGQTVNLLANAYVGSNPTPTMEGGAPSGQHAGVAQLARASAFQAEGRRFESGLPLCGGTGGRAPRRSAPVPRGRRSGSSVVERFLGKEEVAGSIPARSLRGPGAPVPGRAVHDHDPCTRTAAREDRPSRLETRTPR